MKQFISTLLLLLGCLSGQAQEDALSLYRHGVQLYTQNDTAHSYDDGKNFLTIENMDSINRLRDSRFKQALRLLKQSAQTGCDSAQFLLGIIYADNHASKDAFNIMLAAAQQGHVLAQFQVALYYANGQGTKPNNDEAFKWLIQAAQAGSGDAMYQLGLSYMEAGMQTEAQELLLLALKSNTVSAGYRYDMCQRLIKLFHTDKDFVNALQAMSKQYIDRQYEPLAHIPRQGMCVFIDVDPVTKQPVHHERRMPNQMAGAVFPGGTQALDNAVNALLVYPAQARDAGIEGRTIVQFDCDEQGRVVNASVMLSSHPLLDAEAIRVIKSLPNFEPQTIDGHPAKSLGFYEFDFKLN